MRLVRTPARDVHAHVLSVGAEAVAHSPSRGTGRTWTPYADAKTEVITAIRQRAHEADP